MTLDRKELSKLYSYYFVLIVIINIVNTLSIAFIDGNLALLIAIIWMVITIIAYFIIKDSNTGLIVYSIFNAVVSGIAISSYYSIKSILPFNSVIFLIVFGLIMLLSYKSIIEVNDKNLFFRINIFTTILILIVSITIWITSSPTIGSGMVFFCIVYLCFNISILRIYGKDINYAKILGYASLIMFGGVLYAVILALSEGDGIDIIDANWWGKSKKKKS